MGAGNPKFPVAPSVYKHVPKPSDSTTPRYDAGRGLGHVCRGGEGNTDGSIRCEDRNDRGYGTDSVWVQQRRQPRCAAERANIIKLKKLKQPTFWNEYIRKTYF